ncbi:MAG: hypothetical protein HZB75_00560 [Candidatus Saccharibacteria bacterium]|nr:MAG: hypothetical protein HZB75_00560 [Candidatus Saccharibacteria bacterium]
MFIKLRNWLIKILGGTTSSPVQQPSASVSRRSQRRGNANSGSVIIAPTTDIRIDNLEKQIKALEKTTDKHHGEQRNIIIGAVFATVLIVASVAAEVIMFNATFNQNLDSAQKQQREDYKSLQEEINRTKDALHQEIITQIRPTPPQQQ